MSRSHVSACTIVLAFLFSAPLPAEQFDELDGGGSCPHWIIAEAAARVPRGKNEKKWYCVGGYIHACQIVNDDQAWNCGQGTSIAGLMANPPTPPELPPPILVAAPVAPPGGGIDMNLLLMLYLMKR